MPSLAPESRQLYPVKGLDIATLILKRTVSMAKVAIPSSKGIVPLISPGGPYTGYVWLRDFFYSAESASEADIPLSMVNDAILVFAESIGGDPVNPKSPAEHIREDGLLHFRPGGDPGVYPSFDSAAFFTMLCALAYERGNTAVYAQHKTACLEALDSIPRDSGLAYSDPGAAQWWLGWGNTNASVGWGFEDSLVRANMGHLGIASAYLAVAYRKLASMAALEGDTATANDCSAKAQVIVDALASLRLPGGLYAGNSFNPLRHVMLSAFMVYYGLIDSPTEVAETCDALLAEYNTPSAFSGGGPGGTISQNGGVRHLVYPETQLDTSWTYQNGTSWLGPWVGWLSYAIGQSDSAKGQELLQNAVWRLSQEERAYERGPSEWFYVPNNTAMGGNYVVACGFVHNCLPENEEVLLSGAPLSTATVDFVAGLPGDRAYVTSTSSFTGTIAIEYAQGFSYLDDTDVQPSAYSDFVLAGNVYVDNSSNGQAILLPLRAMAMGGKIRATLVSGSSSSPISLKFGKVPARFEPTTLPQLAVLDDFSVDYLTSKYSVTGPFAVDTARKYISVNSGVDGDNAIFTDIAPVLNGEFGFKANKNVGTSYPCFMLRYSGGDPLNSLHVMFDDSYAHVYDQGALLNSYYLGHPLTWRDDVRVVLDGNRLAILVNGNRIGYCFCLHTITPGHFGFMRRGLAAVEIAWSNLSYTPLDQTYRVPAGYTLAQSLGTVRQLGFFTSSDPLLWYDLPRLVNVDGEQDQINLAGHFRIVEGDYGVRFLSVAALDQKTLRLQFSGVVDYPAPVSVKINKDVVVPVSTIIDGTTVTLAFYDPLPNGVGEVSVSESLTSNGLMAYPKTIEFVVDFPSDVIEPVADFSYTNIRKFMPEAFGGPNTNAVLKAVSTGDDVSSSNAKSMFSQAFLETASDVYLNQRAGEYGYTRPEPLMSDTRFRQFVKTIKTDQVTESALWALLEVFYGPKKTRASAYSNDTATGWALFGGETIEILFDGSKIVKVVFDRSDFNEPGKATAQEVVGVINDAMSRQSYRGLAIVEPTAFNDSPRIRVCSERLGFSGSVEIYGDFPNLNTVSPPYWWGSEPLVFDLPVEFPFMMPWTFTDAGNGYVWVTPSVGYTDIPQDLAFTGLGPNNGYFRVLDTKRSLSGSTYPISYLIYNPNAVFGTIAQGYGRFKGYGAVAQFTRKWTLTMEPDHASVVSKDGSLTITLPSTPIVESMEGAVEIGKLGSLVLGDTSLVDFGGITSNIKGVLDKATPVGVDYKVVG